MDFLRDNIPTGYCFPRKFSPLKFEGFFLLKRIEPFIEGFYIHKIYVHNCIPNVGLNVNFILTDI